MEIRLPMKKIQEILEALAHIMDSPGGMVRLEPLIDAELLARSAFVGEYFTCPS